MAVSEQQVADAQQLATSDELNLLAALGVDPNSVHLNNTQDIAQFLASIGGPGATNVQQFGPNTYNPEWTGPWWEAPNLYASQVPFSSDSQQIQSQFTNPTTPVQTDYNKFVSDYNNESYLSNQVPRDNPGLFTQIFDDIALAGLTAGTAGVLGPDLGPGLAGAEAGGIVNGPMGLVTGALGGEAGELGTAGSIAANTALGAARSAISGQDALQGALTGGVTAGLSSALSSAGSNASGSSSPSGAAAALPGVDTDIDLTTVSPDLTYAGSSDLTSPVADASIDANFVNPGSAGGATGPNDTLGSGSITGGTGQSNSSVVGTIGKTVGSAATSAGVPAILSALGIGGSSSPAAAAPSTAPSTSTSPSLTTATPVTPSATTVDLTPSPAGSPLGDPVELGNSASILYQAPTYGGGQKGYSGGSSLSRLLEELGFDR